ncbi:STAS domain-containing protein [Actinoplanes sp. NEAU-A12]|uniref:STAS domain-containing protein n=1 Tax=Actinoplanes sandaracinus TaxID=3045177 RepID=A0ABT6X1I9_9ACTN|nr:STAS domain-containing protein [Actinoplanes sandaracinus]MDI6105868.1 STAS domain-containing protein [Actinoplanes sandaracinus]
MYTATRSGSPAPTAAAALFRERITVLLPRRAPRIEWDLREIGFCDAAGVREVVTLRDHLEQQDAEVVLVAASPTVRLVLHLLGMAGWAWWHSPMTTDG